MPGSTFKVVTTGIALENGVATLDSQFADEREWVPPQTDDPIQNYNGSLCGGDLADRVRPQLQHPLRAAGDVARARGDGRRHRSVGDRRDVADRPPAPDRQHLRQHRQPREELPLLAIRGFGQSEVQMVPLHMAMVAATVANGGQMMTPYAVESTFDQEGRVLDETSPSVWKTPISPETAEIERQLMIGVAERGTASCCIALNGGIPVAAKTGTAQLGDPIESRPVARLDRRVRAS